MRDARHDVQAAVRWLRANRFEYRIHRERIALRGGSAGAVTSLEAGYHADDPGNSGNPGYRSDVQAVISRAGTALGGEGTGTGDAPAALFHARTDPMNPIENARRTCELAQAAGLVCRLTEYERGGRGHHLTPYTDDIRERAYRFLYRHLDLG